MIEIPVDDLLLGGIFALIALLWTNVWSPTALVDYKIQVLTSKRPEIRLYRYLKNEESLSTFRDLPEILVAVEGKVYDVTG
jgi:hypothetical protein